MSLTPETELEFTTLRAKAAAARRAFAQSPISRFVRAMRQCIRDYLQAREEGVSREDGIRGIEEVLRAEWPGRTSKFTQCVGCCGTGWRLTECTHALRCGRERCSRDAESWVHTFVVPCECLLGDPFRRSGQQPQAVDDLAVVGKTKKRGWSRLGR